MEAVIKFKDKRYNKGSTSITLKDTTHKDVFNYLKNHKKEYLRIDIWYDSDDEKLKIYYSVDDYIDSLN